LKNELYTLFWYGERREHAKWGSFSLNGLIEFLKLWDALMNFTLTSDDDQHIWKHDILGSFSSKMAYKAFFYGSIQFEP
jgi:hypothetical protein